MTKAQSSPQSANVTARFQALVDSSQLSADAAQFEAARRLDALNDAFFLHAQSGLATSVKKWLGKPVDAPRGLYIFGAVGRGKSMLMDMFFEGAQVKRKRRVHFHAFMQETHARIHAFRQSARHDGDPMPAVAKEIAAQVQLLCFDEFQVKDIADASILGRLFGLLLDAGIVMVATSNRAPDDLYKGGLNRHRFVPFIDTLKQRLDVLELHAAQDYRLARLQARPVWFTPCGPKARAALDERFHALSEGVAVAPIDLHLKGRTLPVPQAAGRYCAPFLCRFMCRGARGGGLSDAGAAFSYCAD